MKCKTIQIMEGSAFVVAAICTPLAVGLERLGCPKSALAAAAINAGAIALKAYLSSSPKDTATVTP